MCNCQPINTALALKTTNRTAGKDSQASSLDGASQGPASTCEPVIVRIFNCADHTAKARAFTVCRCSSEMFAKTINKLSGDALDQLAKDVVGSGPIHDIFAQVGYNNFIVEQVAVTHCSRNQPVRPTGVCKLSGAVLSQVPEKRARLVSSASELPWKIVTACEPVTVTVAHSTRHYARGTSSASKKIEFLVCACKADAFAAAVTLVGNPQSLNVIVDELKKTVIHAFIIDSSTNLSVITK